MQNFYNPIMYNPLKTREDFTRSLYQIVDPCKKVFVEGNTGLLIANTMASYSAKGTLLESWSRLLWALGPLKSGGQEWEGQKEHRKGMINGTDPSSPYYWGDIGDMDQRMVETAAIATSLILSPDFYWDPLTSIQKDHVIAYLDATNRKLFPQCNWLFFRVLANIALKKLKRSEFEPTNLEKDLSVIESWYEGDGWYKDEVQFDNYNNWAFQYYSALYYAFMKDEDPIRCERMKKRLFLFSNQMVNYYTKGGVFVPYGRSLTYRIADVAFYSACAFAGLEVLPYGVMKGIILRNLRWWFAKPIFDRDGLLTIGYVNPSLLVADQYNAPGSPYWGLKVYILLSLPKDHPFWTSEEKPLPELPKTTLLPVPHALFQRTSDDDVVLLNGGQYPQCKHLHIAEKYAKFAYSAHYAFSTAASYYDFKNTGCDSMLYVNAYDDYWLPRRESEVLFESEEYIVSKWSPLKEVEITTYLIPVGDYHVRVHKVETTIPLTLKEGGFSIEKYRGLAMEQEPLLLQDNPSSLGIQMPWDMSVIDDPLKQSTSEAVSPIANVNLNFATTLTPVLTRNVKEGTTILITVVGASSKIDGFYKKRPKVTLSPHQGTVTIKGDKIKNRTFTTCKKNAQYLLKIRYKEIGL